MSMNMLWEKVKLLFFLLFSFSRGRERRKTRQKVMRGKQLQTTVLVCEMVESGRTTEKRVIPIRLQVNARVWVRDKSIFLCSICSSGAERDSYFWRISHRHQQNYFCYSKFYTRIVHMRFIILQLHNFTNGDFRFVQPVSFPFLLNFNNLLFPGKAVRQ